MLDVAEPWAFAPNIVEDGGDFWGKSETMYQYISETPYI
jgi:hypothetical protein